MLFSSCSYIIFQISSIYRQNKSYFAYFSKLTRNQIFILNVDRKGTYFILNKFFVINFNNKFIRNYSYLNYND